MKATRGGERGGYHEVPPASIYQASENGNGLLRECESSRSGARRRRPRKSSTPSSDVPSSSSDMACSEGSVQQRFRSPTSTSRSNVVVVKETSFRSVETYSPNVRLARRNLTTQLFPEYWSADTVNDVLKTGAVFSCTLRINAHYRQEAYASIEGVSTDILLDGELAQNRAVEGDVVALVVDAPAHWPRLKGFSNIDKNPKQTDGGTSTNASTSANMDSSFDGSAIGNAKVSSGSSGSDTTTPAGLVMLKSWVSSTPGRRPTGRVVAILKQSFRREALVGHLTKREVNQGGESLMFTPLDSRFPKMVVSLEETPMDIARRVKDDDPTVWNELLAAYMKEWNSTSTYPYAVITRSMGQAGEIEAQTAAILFEHAVHSAEFPPEALADLPRVPWKIPEVELAVRKDLRKMRVFSIDPVTARDLDDALSIQRLENGLFRVGVHIADVTYFIESGSALDREAAARSTSVYMIGQVLPMLPRLLCEELCSLNPGVDRLAFSVIWDVDGAGNVVNQWAGRSVIRSCCKLSYEVAQAVIDGNVVNPVVYGGFTVEDVVEDVGMLWGIAKERRKRRFERGALRLDTSKITFVLDDDGSPCDTKMYEQGESNQLVEEFMLLANMTVAKIISAAFPESALLRRHPEPNERKLKEFADFCNKHGFILNTNSAAALHSSLENLREAFKDDPVLVSILVLYATKPMQVAKYFCAGGVKDVQWAHYALAASAYTHFTSPIRRYPDIVVHRMLTAALEAEQELVGCSSESEKSVVLQSVALKHRIPDSDDIAELAAHCNEKKMSSRFVQDATDKVYLWSMLRKKQGLLSDACVLGVGPKFMSLYVCSIAMERRLYYDDIDSLKVEWLENTGTLVLDYAPPKRKIQHGKCKGFLDVAEVEDSNGSGDEDVLLVAEALPLTLRLFSRIPVLVHAAGGDSRPLDIGVKLYVSSYRLGVQ